MPGVSTRGGRRADVAAVDAPCISLRLLREGDRATIRALRDALRTAPGWFSLDAEVAIPSSLVRECYARAREFFSLPTALKRSYAHTQYARETGGYVPLLEEYAYRPNEIAILESFDTVRDVDASRLPAEATGVGPVDWPLECPGMKTALRAFYEAADEVARDLLRALARARFVGDGDEQTAAEVADADALAERLLAGFTETSACSMRAMRYPGTEDKRVRARVRETLVGFSAAEDSELETRRGPGKRPRRGDEGVSKRFARKREGDATRSVSSSKEKHSTRASRSRARAVGIAEHTDFECFTLLHQDAPGLLLRDVAGAWREAGVFSSALGPRSTFTVIVGDAFERVSGGFFRATPHRVALTRHERFALVRFNGLDPEASIAPFVGAREYAEKQNEKNKRRTNDATTQGEHVARRVTRAARHLENAVKRGAVPGVDVARLGADAAPVKFAQLLIVASRQNANGGDGGRSGASGSGPNPNPNPNPYANAREPPTDAPLVLLGKHRAGEFAGQYTGFIARVAPFETPRRAAMRAAQEGGVRFRFPITGFPEASLPSSPGRDANLEKSLSSLRERARFRFEGWLADDRVAVEHEFVLRVKDVRDVRFANEEPDDFEPRGMARDAREALLSREKNETENARARTMNIRSSDGHFFEDGRTRGSTEPKWFAREDIPYGSMPADDAVWYPRLFALLDADDAKEPSRETPASTASLAPTDSPAPTDRKEGGRTEKTESAWTNALAGRFAFDETGTLRRDWEVRVLATDAAM